MKMSLSIIFIALSAAAIAVESVKVDVPGYVIEVSSDPRGEEFWMADTKPMEVFRYGLTNESLRTPLLVTVLRYTSSGKARDAFDLSWRARPQAPANLRVIGWDAAHRWPTDMYLLKDRYLVGLYRLPSDFSAEQLDKLLHALTDNISKAEPGGAANGSQPIRTETNRASAAPPKVVFDNRPEFGIPFEARLQEKGPVESHGTLAELVTGSIEIVTVRYFSGAWSHKQQVSDYLTGLLDDDRTAMYTVQIWSQGVGEPEIECLLRFKNGAQGRLLLWQSVACVRDDTGKWWFVSVFDYYHRKHPQGDRRLAKEKP